MDKGFYTIICAIKKAYADGKAEEANNAVAYGIKNYDLKQATLLWLCFSKQKED